MKKRVLAVTGAVLVTVFIFYMSSLTAVESDGISLSIVDRLMIWMSGLTNIDVMQMDNLIRETAHFVEFAVLGVMLGLACHGRRWWLPMLIGVGIALADETLQLFVEGRTFQVLDLGLDISGIFVSVIVCLLINIKVGFSINNGSE